LNLSKNLSLYFCYKLTYLPDHVFFRPLHVLHSQIIFLSNVIIVNACTSFVLGISHVLNTAEELHDFKYPLGRLKVHHVLMYDAEEQDLLQYLDQCVDHIHSVVEEGGNILVHCVAGVSRSASVCIAYLIKYQRMTLHAAFKHVSSRRSCICPNLGFWQQLIKYEVRLTGDSSITMMPTVLGSVPSVLLHDYENRIRASWMPELICHFSIHFFILLVQLIAMWYSEV